jgi:hypothetical protein
MPDVRPFSQAYLGFTHRAKGSTVNPNQMNYVNALVAQHEFRDEASRSRQGERTERRPEEVRETRGDARKHSVFTLLGVALPGRR